jgi:DNA-binding transcriptional LysR family regulator
LLNTFFIHSDTGIEQRQLINFLKVCEEKSIAKAAPRCFISHQGLSKSIKLLEDEFGIALFIRTKKGLELTEAGKVLQSLIIPFIDQHDDIALTVMSFSDALCQKSIREYHLDVGFSHAPIDIDSFESFLCKK